MMMRIQTDGASKGLKEPLNNYEADKKEIDICSPK